MALVDYKKMILEKKERMMMQLTIEPYEIIMIVNHAWDCSFGHITSNKKAIIDRGGYSQPTASTLPYSPVYYDHRRKG